MNSNDNTILFTLIYDGEVYPVQVQSGQFYSLMILISDRLGIGGFGLCCGMGSCGTCMVTIGEHRSSFLRTTLSCQTRVDDDLANTSIIIDPSSY